MSERVIVLEQSRLTQEEIEAAFRGAAGQLALRAALQIVGDQLADVRQQTSHIEAAREHGVLAHCAGGQEWLTVTRALLAEHLEVRS